MEVPVPKMSVLEGVDCVFSNHSWSSFQDGNRSPTLEPQVGPIPSSEDDEPGITFEASRKHGKMGRYPSFEENEAKQRET